LFYERVFVKVFDLGRSTRTDSNREVIMNTTSTHTDPRLVSTTAAQRRRRHLAVYHRALRSAETPEQRAAVAARYRRLFSPSPASTGAAAGVSEVTVIAAA